MAERRMFAKTIITSDAFLDMPATARCLYFTLAMLADDDGFINSPKSIMRQVGATTDDMNILVSKKFVLVFDSGVLVIKHWRIHNYIRSDRYTPTKYQEEKDSLFFDENGAYTQSPETLEIPTRYTAGIPMVDERLPQDRIGKDRLGKDKNKYNDEFETLWKDYPKKQGKQSALKSYVKARKEGISHEAISEGMYQYIDYIKAKITDDRYIKQGSTFFNQRAWQDDWRLDTGYSLASEKKETNPFTELRLRMEKGNDTD